TVRIKNSATETKTNGLGDFEFKSVDVGTVLIFSSVGFETREIVFNGSDQQLNVVLNNSSSSLEEVVVVGYGTQKKVNLTGAVATVSGKDMVKRPVVNPAAMLQGAIPGVQV